MKLAYLIVQKYLSSKVYVLIKVFLLGKINSFYVSNSTIKVKINENSKPIFITHCADFEECFPNVDLSPPGK